MNAGEILRRNVERETRAITARHEAELRRMLGKWASGLEPILALSARSGDLLGLTISVPLGTVAPIVVRAWEE